MALDMTLALTLGTITLGIGIPLGIKFAPRIKKAFAKSQQGDASTIQTGSIAGEKPAVVLNTGDGNTILNNSGPIINAHPRAGKTQKLSARREILAAFKRFFYTFLGNEKIGGMLTHKPNLDPTKPDSFASHFETSAQHAARAAKDKLSDEVQQHAPALENDEIENRLNDLVQKLLKITNLFEITPTLRKSVCAEVASILGTGELS